MAALLGPEPLNLKWKANDSKSRGLGFRVGGCTSGRLDPKQVNVHMPPWEKAFASKM